jgi:hypothetical protein
MSKQNSLSILQLDLYFLSAWEPAVVQWVLGKETHISAFLSTKEAQ